MEQQTSPCACFNLRKASRVATKIFEDHIAPTGLYAQQFMLLYGLKTGGDMNITQLSNILQINRTTLSRDIVPLQRKGYLTTSYGTDRRNKLISLTSDGHKAIETATPLWIEAQTKVVNHLGQEKFQMLLHILQKLNQLEE